MSETFTYWGINLTAMDAQLQDRVTACAAKEGIPEPQGWAYAQRWVYAAAPGWANAYEYALANGNPEPGKDPAVITDAMILTQVQSMRT